MLLSKHWFPRFLSPGLVLSILSSILFSELPLRVHPVDQTITPAVVEDRIFGDGFESHKLNRWAIKENDGNDLHVNADAALVGNEGMKVIIDDPDSVYVGDDTPDAERRYRARFYFDPNSIEMREKKHALFQGYNGAAVPVVEV
jgi:hypothetical protein